MEIGKQGASPALEMGRSKSSKLTLHAISLIFISIQLQIPNYDEFIYVVECSDRP